ncbi:hypothetical protein GOV08_01010 [Candidatus Woesearchaeota archaeon]|nr:hypothetical protein [Candidatus Woesearchaeota archaeon]
MTEDEDNTINITYETLFELLRREKNREEMQKLQDNFYEDVVSYLAEKKKVFLPESKDLFSDDEREKTLKQIQNTKRIIQDLFERREKKIIVMALNKVRTESSLTDTSPLLNSEKAYFEKMVELFSSNRQGILNNILNGDSPEFKPTPRKEESSAAKKEEVEQPLEAQSSEFASVPKPKSKKTVRFIGQVPKFVGKELEVYGPFNPDDMASLPADIANVLIKKKRAEEVNVE